MKIFKLPEKELRLLYLLHKAEKVKNKADKIKAVYLLGKGWKISDIKEALLLDENTIYRYYDLYKKEGVGGLILPRYQGSESFLAKDEIKEMENHLEENPCRTTKEIIDYVNEEFGINYSVSGMNSLLKRLNFTYRKPHPIPGKADKKQQELFIKKYRKIRLKMNKEDSLFFMDGVHPHHNPLVKCGWFKKGKKYPLKTNTRYTRMNIIGAVDIDKLDVVSQDFLKLNEESTLDFLEKLRKKRPTGYIYLILDNAGYYNTKKVKKYAEAIGIKLLYLPAYSPNLNVIERLWGFMQKQILYNRYYATFMEFRETCLKFLKNLRWRKSELQSLLTENFEKLPGY